ncbi:hypothetical protein [Anaerosporobacter sp.]
MKLKRVSIAILTYIVVFNLLDLFFNSWEKVLKQAFYQLLVGVAVFLIFYFIDKQKRNQK